MQSLLSVGHHACIVVGLLVLLFTLLCEVNLHAKSLVSATLCNCCLSLRVVITYII